MTVALSGPGYLQASYYISVRKATLPLSLPSERELTLEERLGGMGSVAHYIIAHEQTIFVSFRCSLLPEGLHSELILVPFQAYLFI